MSHVIVGKGMRCNECKREVKERLEECDECATWLCSECIDNHECADDDHGWDDW